MRYFLLIPFLFLFACGSLVGPSYHLKKAKRHLALAGEMGVNFKRDTVIKEVITSGSVSDTTVDWYESEGVGFWIEDWQDVITDTLIVETVKWKTKTKFIRDTVHRTVKVFQQVECKPDTVRIPCETSLEISTGTTRENFMWGAAGGLLGMILCLLIFALVVKVDRRK